MENNRRDRINQFIVFLLIISIVGGNYLASFNIAGFEIYAYRLILFIAAFYLILTKQFILYTSNFTKKVFYIFLFWILYAILSLIWTPNLVYGIKDIFYIAIGFTFYIVLLSLNQNWKTFRLNLQLSWTATYIFVLFFALFETMTRMHLEGAFLENISFLGAYHYANYIPVVSFVSQNIFAIYLCITIILSTYSLILSEKIYLNGFIIGSAIALLLFTESRFALVFLSFLYLILIVALLFQPAILKKSVILIKKKLFITSTLIIVCSVFYLSFQSFFNTISFANYGTVTIEQQDSPTNSEFRQNLDKNSLVLVSDGIKADTNNLHLPNKVLIIEERTYQKLLKGNELQLSTRIIPRGTQIDKKVYGSSLFSITFYTVFALLILATTLSFCFPHFRFNASTTIYLGSTILILGGGILSQYHVSEANLDTRDKVLFENNEQITLHSNFNKISVDPNTAKMLFSKGENFTWIFQTKTNHDISEISNKSSLELRKNLILNGLSFLKESNYIGIGAGAYRTYSLNNKELRPVQGLVDPHNFVIEILSQYGIVIFGLLLYIGFLIIKKMLNDTLQKKVTSIHLLVLGLILCLLFLGNSNSTFLSLPINWFLIALIIIASNQMINNQQNIDEA